VLIADAKFAPATIIPSERSEGKLDLFGQIRSVQIECETQTVGTNEQHEGIRLS
jgi:hypothetical protein